MNRDFFFNPELQFQPHWKMMTLTPEKTTNDVIFRQNWAKSDQYSQFDSTVSSIVSSPVSNSTVSNDIVAVGKLGNMSLNSSPQELNLPIMNHFNTENFAKIRNSIPMDPNLPLLAADPAFAERAAKFSCFGSRSFNGRTHQLESNVSPVTRVSSSSSLQIDRSPEENMKLGRLSASAANSNEESSVSEQIPPPELKIKKQNDSSSRKRKGEIGSNTTKGEEAIDDLKKPKKTEDENGGETKEKTNPPEPPKDYIHVRARRGQATDSHSLAERVRREKISERMKLLQNLVPNCNKVTGKALMLDEIINYVQSLQKQVEFLSMKLATVNPSLDSATDDTITQNIIQSNAVNLSQQISNFHQQNHQEIFNESALMTQSIHEFTEPFQDFRRFGEDDLHSIARMGFDQNLNFDMSFFHTSVDQLPNMKTEL